MGLTNFYHDNKLFWCGIFVYKDIGGLSTPRCEGALIKWIPVPCVDILRIPKDIFKADTICRKEILPIYLTINKDQFMRIDQILTAVGLIGLGGLLKSIVDFFIASRRARQDAKHAFKEVRYKTIILLCFALVHYDKEKTTLVINRPDINSMERLTNELNAEFINMLLFASDNVIQNVRAFLQNPDRESLNSLALAMRKDLYGIKTKLKVTDVIIEFS